MWLATGSLLTVWWRIPVSGGEIAPCLLALAVAHLPLCLWRWGGEGPIHSQLAVLWYLLNPLFCEWFRLHITAFCGIFLSLSLSFFLFFFFFISGYPTDWVAISHQLPQIVLRAFKPSPYPKDATRASLSSPSSDGLECLVYFSPGSCSQAHNLWVFFFFSSSWLCCPLRFQIISCG